MDELQNASKDLESGAPRSSEQQALDDASTEPAAVVESGKDYQSAETIQANLTAAVDSASAVHEITAAPQMIAQPGDGSVKGSLPAVRGDLGQVTASDGPKGPPATPIPLPGPEAAAAAPAKTAGTAGKDLSIPIRQGKIINDPLSRESAGGQKSGDSAPAAGENATAAEPQEGKPVSDKGQAIKTGEGKTIQQPTGKRGPGNVGAAKIPGPERIIPELAKDARDLIGMGANGMIDGAGPQKAVHSGKIKGYGPGAVDNTHSTKVPSFGNDLMPGFLKPGTSGGGPPVHGYGPGMVGAPAGKSKGNTKGKAGDKGTKPNKGSTTVQGFIKEKGAKTAIRFNETSKDSGSSTTERLLVISEISNGKGGTGLFRIHGKDGWWVINWSGGDLVMWKVKNTVDGVSPIPYTGGAAQGTQPNPQTIGGKDVESGHYTPLVTIGGKTVSGGGVSGEPGTEWDEGHWYGGLFGSAGRPNDPDNPDYYTPNILDQADKAEKSNS